MLEKVQMTPCLFNGVVRLEAHLAAFGAREHAPARKTKSDIETLLARIEFARNHLPRRGQTKGQLEKIGISHMRSGLLGCRHGFKGIPT